MIDLTSDVLPIPTSRQTTEADAAADVSCMRPDTTSTAMASNVVKINPRIIRQWINRLPFFTRIILVIDVVLYFASIFAPFVSNTLSLEPSKVHLFSAHRLTTYPCVHAHFFQALLSIPPLVFLLDRFESEHGSLVSLVLFTGPFSTIPGALYILVDHLILQSNHVIQGASMWVFLLLGCEAVKIYRSNPSFNLGGFQIPTWTSALVAIFVINFLIPNTSLLGHLCSALVGYGWELGYLKFLVPPERILRWIESKLNLLGRLPHYVSVDQKTFGRYGVLPSREDPEVPGTARSFFVGSSQRLGP